MRQPSTSVAIRDNKVIVNGSLVFETAVDTDPILFFKEIYKFLGLNYLKFFKMDPLSKLGFLAVELLLTKKDVQYKEEYNILLACSHSSIESDTQFQTTIDDATNYFPSPAVFVYTLPNIVIGEIAIRHQIFGDNCMFLYDPNERVNFFEFAIDYALQNFKTPTILGYLDYNKKKYIAEFHFIN
jgi:hypothetical protein